MKKLLLLSLFISLLGGQSRQRYELRILNLPEVEDKNYPMARDLKFGESYPVIFDIITGEIYILYIEYENDYENLIQTKTYVKKQIDWNKPESIKIESAIDDTVDDKAPKFDVLAYLYFERTGKMFDRSKTIPIKDFVLVLRQAYPEYNDLSDSTLVERVIKKYPQYKSWIKE